MPLGCWKTPICGVPLIFPVSKHGRLIATYLQVRLTPQDCLPDRQVKGAAGALHLGIFEQPMEIHFFILAVRGK